MCVRGDDVHHQPPASLFLLFGVGVGGVEGRYFLQIVVFILYYQYRSLLGVIVIIPL